MVLYQKLITNPKGGNDLEHNNRQFKKNSQSGEHRNGRKSQFKNYNAQKGEEPNEFLSKRDEKSGNEKLE